ncbi:MAG TPA: helix-turn-helix domain-containing protein [Gemmatimonadales bacterium]|nr:helix-turn-helix domain-containing protein [Gemmatimonadales bacterium]
MARLTDEQKVAILQLDKLGKEQLEIAQLVGCHQSSVSRWLSQFVDTSHAARAYALGNALPTMESVLRYGKAADKVNVLKGIGVLTEQQNTGLTIQIGGTGDLKVAVLLSPHTSTPQGESE